MYDELYAPLPDIDEYLDRIELERSGLCPGIPGIETIIRAHLSHIPFENLDAWAAGRAPDLGINALFDKIIRHRRGGWCFELNGLLCALLAGLGYEVYNVGVRVLAGGRDRAFVSHRGVIALVDGEKYYCDVGFGTLAIPEPVALDGHISGSGFFIREENGEKNIYVLRGDAPELIMRFLDRPFPPEDYLAPNFYNAVDPSLPFRRRLSVSIQKGDTRYQLVDLCLREYCSDVPVRSISIADKTELSHVLWEYFGIEYALPQNETELP